MGGQPISSFGSTFAAASLGRLGNVLCRHEGCNDFFILLADYQGSIGFLAAG